MGGHKLQSSTCEEGWGRSQTAHQYEVTARGELVGGMPTIGMHAGAVIIVDKART